MKMKATQHTQGPWEVSTAMTEQGGYPTKIRAWVNRQLTERTRTGANCESICGCFGPNAEIHAELICRACNSHDELLAACELLVSWMEQHHPEAANNIPTVRAAIAKATA